MAKNVACEYIVSDKLSVAYFGYNKLKKQVPQQFLTYFHNASKQHCKLQYFRNSVKRYAITTNHF